MSRIAMSAGVRDALLADDAILPSQLLDCREKLAEPERRLLAAILDSAVQDWRECRDRRGRDGVQAEMRRHEVRRWMQGAPARFSFAYTCQILALDPRQVRKAVLGP